MNYTAEQIAEINKIQSRVRKIKKSHKLYFRDSNGTLRRLDKVAVDIYGLIIVDFLKGDAEKRYSDLNSLTKSWQELIPLPMEIASKYSAEWSKLVRTINPKEHQASVTISYNGSWKPLVRLTLQEDLSTE